MDARERWVRRLATWFGCGNVPLAPGTMGALGAVPLHYLLKRFNPAVYFAAVAIISAVGIWSADEMAKLLGEKDPQCVVIDEVAGTLIAMGMVQKRGTKAELLALALFRAYDILKPGPVGKAEHAKPPGLGIMADDLVAGLLAGLTTLLVV
jgi:phosphatidylglycerophosphatase A